MQRFRSLAPLALAAAACSAFAEGDVDLQVRGNEKILGTLRPADQTEDFVLDAPRGALLTLNLKKLGDGGPVPSFEVLDDVGTVLSTGTPNPKGAKVQSFPLPESGRYRVRVRGDGVLDGDYQLKLAVRSPSGVGVGDEAPLDPGATVDVQFSAPRDATAGFDFAAWRTPKIAPRLVSLDGPDGFHHDFGAEGQAATRHKVRGVPLGAMGDYTLRLRNDGAAAGAWSAGISLAFPGVSKSTVDIRDSELSGTFAEANEVFGRVVDLAGGLVNPTDPASALFGSSVDVPPDAMSAPTVIALSSSDTFFVDDADHAAGIALRLTPSGTQFAVPVTVTLPYDPQSFDDPLSELSVYIEDGATGALVAVDRGLLEIDTVNARVSFPTSHFSRFQGTTPRPRPVKGTFLQVEIGGRFLQGGVGQVVFGGAIVSAFQGPRSGNGFQRDLERTFLTFGANGLAFVKGGGSTDAGILEIEDDSRITMRSGTDGDLVFVRGRNPDVLIQPPGPGDLGASTSVLLRLADAPPTKSTLAGRWHAAVLEFAASQDPGGGVRLQTTGQNLELDIGPDLSVKALRSIRRVASAAPEGGWQVVGVKEPPPGGTLAFTEGGLALAMQLGTSPLGPPVRLLPVLRGDALIGTSSGAAGPPQTPTAAAMRIVVLVRASDAASPLSVLGDALTSSFGLAISDGADGAQGLAFLGEDARARHLGDRSLDVKGTRTTLSLDAAGNPARAVDALLASSTYTVARDGNYFEREPPTSGAVVTRGGFYVVTRALGPVFSLGFGVVGPQKD